MNSINVIAPYRYQGMWVFTDKSKGLDKEPFIAGADAMIDRVVGDADACTMVFSDGPFPGYQYRLDWQRVELTGNVYRSDDLGMEGWLCPALLKYFDKAPASIFVSVTPANA